MTNKIKQLEERIAKLKKKRDNLKEKMKDYKVEMKPTLWHVKLSEGSYSDYNEDHLFFSGNDENEIWNFLCRYVDSQDYGEHRFVNSKMPLAMKWNDKTYKSCFLLGEDYFYNHNYVNVEIERLNVIYFNK